MDEVPPYCEACISSSIASSRSFTCAGYASGQGDAHSFPPNSVHGYLFRRINKQHLAMIKKMVITEETQTTVILSFLPS